MCILSTADSCRPIQPVPILKNRQGLPRERGQFGKGFHPLLDSGDRFLQSCATRAAAVDPPAPARRPRPLSRMARTRALFVRQRHLRMPHPDRRIAPQAPRASRARQTQPVFLLASVALPSETLQSARAPAAGPPAARLPISVATASSRLEKSTCPLDAAMFQSRAARLGRDQLVATPGHPHHVHRHLGLLEQRDDLPYSLAMLADFVADQHSDAESVLDTHGVGERREPRSPVSCQDCRYSSRTHRVARSAARRWRRETAADPSVQRSPIGTTG